MDLWRAGERFSAWASSVQDDGSVARVRFVSLLAIAVLVTRFWPPLGRDGFGPMEVSQIDLARMQWDAAWWRLLAELHHGPVTPFLLWVNGLPGGWFASDGGQRLSSALAGAALAFVVYAACRRFNPPWTARFAALFVASSAFLADFSRDARLYSLHALLVFLAVWSTDRLLAAPRPGRAALSSLLWAAACLNHLMALPFLAGTCLGLFLARGSPVPARMTAGAAAAAGMIACAPWFIIVARHVVPDPDLLPHTPAWWGTLAVLLGNGVFVWIFAAAVAAVPRWRAWLRPVEGRVGGGAALYGWSALFGVALVGIHGTFVMPVSRHEYLLPAVPLIAIWLAEAASRRAPQLRAGLVVAGVALPFAFIFPTLLSGEGVESGVREEGVAREAVRAARSLEPAEAVIVVPPHKRPSVRFYWPDAPIMKLADFAALPAASRPGTMIVMYWTKRCTLHSSAGRCQGLRNLVAEYRDATRAWVGKGVEVWRFRR